MMAPTLLPIQTLDTITKFVKIKYSFIYLHQFGNKTKKMIQPREKGGLNK